MSPSSIRRPGGGAPGGSYAWLDTLTRASVVLNRRAEAYQASLGNPYGLIASPEWENYVAAAERHDALLDAHLSELISLARTAVKRNESK